MNSVEALVDGFFAAVTAGDREALERIYSPDAAIWHNYDDVEQSREESLRLLAYLHRKVGPLRYEGVRRVVLEDGVIQQHVVVLGGVGAGLRMPTMIRIFCAGDHVTRIEEYVDPGPLNQRLSELRS